MYKQQYQKGKKIKKNRHPTTIKTKYFMVVVLVVLLCVSTAYSLYSTTLHMIGNPEGDLIIVVDPVTSATSREGNYTWYTTNTALTGKPALLLPSATLWVVDSETYNATVITTHIRHKQRAASSLGNMSPTFTLVLRNKGTMNLTNGTITQYESSNAWTDVNPSLSSTTLSAGGTVTVTIRGEFHSSRTVSSGDHNYFRITFQNNGNTFTFLWKFDFEE